MSLLSGSYPLTDVGMFVAVGEKNGGSQGERAGKSVVNARSFMLCVSARMESADEMNRLIPMLPVKSIGESIEFYKKLGFSVEQRNDDWRWAMLCFGDCRLMVDQSINVHQDAPRQGVIYLYPEGIAEYHRQVRENGLEIPELETTFYGLTEFRIDDPDGNRLWIGENTSTAAAEAGVKNY